MGEKKLSQKEINELLVKLIDSAEKTECWTCECLQGFIIQLEKDSQENIE